MYDTEKKKKIQEPFLVSCEDIGPEGKDLINVQPKYSAEPTWGERGRLTPGPFHHFYIRIK